MSDTCACCGGPLYAKPESPASTPPAVTTDKELLQQAADALWKCAKAALTVKPSLDQPYPDDPRWTPYTRWVERPAREAHDLAMTIRKHLKAADARTLPARNGHDPARMGHDGT